MEKSDFRSIISVIAIISIVLILWSMCSNTVHETEVIEDFVVYSQESFREEIVNNNLIDFIDDEVLGEYARTKLAENNTYIVTGTVYNPAAEQCDNDPLTTADGSKINKDKLKNGEIKWIAVSRDLLDVFNYGDKVSISGISEDMDGIYEIHDTMNSRFTKYIDFLVPDHITLGKWENVIIKKIED